MNMQADDRRPRRSRKKNGGVTLSDIAKLAGVSAITASRALNTPEQVSEETLARIRAAVERTGYVPNLLAGGLASNRSRLVAAVVPSLATPVFLEAIEALTATLVTYGYQLMLGQSGYNNSREDALIDAIIGRRPDGIVLTGILHSEQGRKRLHASGIPVVETWDLTPTPIDMLVGFSHQGVGEAAADFLSSKGRRRLATISGDDERAQRRRKAFGRRVLQHGLTEEGGAEAPDVVVSTPTTVGGGRQALARLLDIHPDVDAVFCSSDWLALGVLIEAQARGLSIPARLAVMGFGDHAFAADLHPALTSMRIDGTRIGQTAARLIIARAEGRPVAEPVCDIGFSIIERDSA
ncbi:MAG: LacI family DNA-binding transcriptional regulator [Candidatus Competibacteraceae bacterium]|nr:LacI family DNA-binding transcriptional regulator [Candidatus Competibacteraceae bacterium]